MGIWKEFCCIIPLKIGSDLYLVIGYHIMCMCFQGSFFSYNSYGFLFLSTYFTDKSGLYVVCGYM